jgi:RNA polymerase sigma-70 factor (ECF subfamily)
VATVRGVLPDVSIEMIDVNFEPAFLLRLAGRLDSVYSLEIADNTIQALRVIRNPDKLTFIERQLALR